MSRGTAKRVNSLAARLARRDDWFARALVHVYAPAWRPVLRSLGGILGSRTRLFVAALLRKNREDLCCRPLAAAAIVAMAAGRQALPDTLLDGLSEQALVLYFDHTIWPSRDTSWTMLEACAEYAVPKLINRLSSPDRVTRAVVALTLGRLQAHEAIPELTALLDDEDRLVREWGAMALGIIGSVSAVESVLLQAEDEESVGQYVARGMLRSPHPGKGVARVVRYLESKGLRMELLAARIRARHGLTLPVPRLLEFLDTEDWDSKVLAAEILGQSRPSDVLPQLIERSNHENALVRWAAALALGCMATAKGIPHLERLALDNDYHVRTAANNALEWNRAGKKVPMLRGWLGASTNPRLVQEIRSPTDAAAVARQLGDGSPALRQAALEAIARSGPEAVLQWALSKLDDKNQSDRRHAVLALGEVGVAAQVPDILRLLEDPSRHIRRAAAQATARLGWRLHIPIAVEQAPRSLQIRAKLLETSLEALAGSVEA